jgi:glutaredoxin
MNIKLITTKTCMHSHAIELELRDLGLEYELIYAEEHPEIVSQFCIRHASVLIIDEQRVIDVEGLTEGQLKTVLSLE